MGFYTPDELAAKGFRYMGTGVLVSRLASIHGASRISIGDHTRIDDFCLLSAGEGGIEIGAYAHLAAMCSLIGKARIEVGDFCGVSGKAAIYSSSDDFSGEWMTNPTVPVRFTRVQSAPVSMGRHSVVGAGTVVLPGSIIGEGVAVGALSLVKGDLEAFWIYGGTPAKRLRPRARTLLELEARMASDAAKGHDEPR